MIKKDDEDLGFAKLQNFASTPTAPTVTQQNTVQQPSQLAQPAQLQQPVSSPAQTPATAVQSQPPAPKQFGQPQQPQPAQPRQTLMTPNTAAQRYTQMIQQNLPQAQAVSSGLAQVIQSPADQARRNLDLAQAKFKQQVQESGLTRNAGRTAQLINKAAGLKAGQSLTPAEFAELENISKTRAGFGEGIRDTDFMALQNYVQALGDAERAKQMAALTGDTGSRQELLSQLVGDSTYTQGQSLLDSLLAGGTQESSGQLRDLRQDLLEQDTLGQRAQQIEQQSKGARDLEAQEIEAAYKDIQDLLDGKLSPMEASLRTRLQSEQKRVSDTNALIDRVMPNIGSVFGDTKEEQALIKQLKLTPQQVSQIQASNRDPNLIPKLKDVAMENIISETEANRLRELYKIGDISGRDVQKLGTDVDQSLVGQMPVVDSAKLKDASTRYQQEVESNIKTLKDNELGQKVNYQFNKNLPLSAALPDVYNRLMTGYYNQADEKAASSLIKKAQNILKQENAKRKELGVKEITPVLTPSDKLVQSTLQKMYNQGVVGRSGLGGKPIYTLEQFKKLNPKRYNEILKHARTAAETALAAQYLGLPADKFKV